MKLTFISWCKINCLWNVNNAWNQWNVNIFTFHPRKFVCFFYVRTWHVLCIYAINKLFITYHFAINMQHIFCYIPSRSCKVMQHTWWLSGQKFSPWHWPQACNFLNFLFLFGILGNSKFSISQSKSRFVLNSGTFKVGRRIMSENTKQTDVPVNDGKLFKIHRQIWIHI